MTNNDIAAFFRSQMLTMLAEQGQATINVTSSFQPNNQGRLDGPVLYFSEIGDIPNGGQGSTTTVDSGTGEVTDVSTQRWRISYQVQGLAPANVEDLNALRAADITKLALMLLKSPPFIRALKDEGMGIETIGVIRPNFVVNDQSRFEAGPLFEFTMSYRRTIIQKSAIITTADIAIHRV